MLIEILATFCNAIFAGAAIYINVVEHPARMSLGTSPALAEWAPSYRRAAAMQAPLALVAALAAAYIGFSSARGGWLVGSVLIGMVIPLTILVINPINKQLLDPATAHDTNRVQSLLTRWNRLHALRSASSTLSLVLFLFLLASATSSR